MPHYDYHCDECEHGEERYVGAWELRKTQECPCCQTPMRRIPSLPISYIASKDRPDRGQG